MDSQYPQFLGLPLEATAVDHARVLVLPMPLEATVSYGGGTAAGPAAIIDASHQVELYDREFGRELALEYGIHTLPPVDVTGGVETAVQAIETAVSQAARTGKFIVGLGGEHTVSVGFGRGLLAALGGPITIVQLDAHSDLRDSYEDSPYSHACIARRLVEEAGVEQILQLGIRSVCPEEVAFAADNPEKIRVWYSEDVHNGRWQEEFISRIQDRRVYLTLDVDGLDPSIIPATGTPEPDGLTWQETLTILRTLSRHAHIIGMDCVELAPAPGLHMADFATAKLVYKTIAYALEWGHPA
ncbi:MAG: agmatinase [Candidatus Promineifilaceae bacterium]